MEYDFIFKAGTLLVALIGAAKLLYELTIGGRNRLRDDYRFAKEFLKSIEDDPQMHPFLREKGYQAIAGDTNLSASEIEYLLSLRNPNRALRDYVLGRVYLEHLHGVDDQQLKFRKKYTRPWSRLWRKALYLMIYSLSGFLSLSPIIITSSFSTASQMLIFFFFSLIVFGPTAVFFLVAAARIYRAEKLVENQSKHTQRVVVSWSSATFKRMPGGTN